MDTNKKRSILLSACGPKTYKLLRSLADDIPVLKSYDDLVSLVKYFNHPKPSVIVQRYKFNLRDRTAEKSIATYVAALQQLAEHCDYKDTLLEMLRDRLVCGVNHSGIQKRLLADKDLTFDKALDIAKALEAAEKDIQDITSDTAVLSGSFHFTSHTRLRCYKTPTEKTIHSESCYKCGGAHSSFLCKCKTGIISFVRRKATLQET